MSAPTNTDALLSAALALLGPRQDGMLTAEEWFALARAVAGLTGKKTRDLLTERDLDDIVGAPPLAWSERVDGVLRRGEEVPQVHHQPEHGAGEQPRQHHEAQQ